MTPERAKIDPPLIKPPQREPIFNIPAILLAYTAALFVIHALRTYVLTPATDDWVLDTAAFIPSRYVHPIADQDILGYLLGPVGYSFLHGSWGHLGSNVLFLVIFATPLAARIGPYRFTVLWITSAVASAFFLAVLTGFDMSILVGCSSVVSAMVGASCRFVVPLLSSRRVQGARYAPRFGIIEALGQRSVIFFALIWLMLYVVLSAVDTSQNIAWQAHLGGFLFGYLTFGLFDPPLRH